jgi:hypothetical protein
VANKMAEVVEASSAAFVCQCYELNGAPSLGAFIRVGDPAVYAVVQNVSTGALDPGRRVMARGADEESEDALYQSNPQLSRLLSTHVDALIVGYGLGDAVRHGLPPTPPRLHGFVYACQAEEVVAFTRHQGPSVGGAQAWRFDFLHLLVQSRAPAADEVIAACVRGAAACQREPQPFLVAAGKALAMELGSEIGRLNAILRGLKT